MSEQKSVAAKLRDQAGWARKLGSPLYTLLLERAAEDVEAGGPCRRALEGHESDPGLSLPLQFLGAVHRLVLEGRTPELAAYYPSAGGALPAGECWPAFRRTVEQNVDELRTLVNQPVQTNEVARSCALLGGFLLIARETGLPLRLMEIGASAGLNLRWDHFRYEASVPGWGNPASAVRFESVFDGVAPPLNVDVRVAQRLGCDQNPLDPALPETELILRSFTWPDHVERQNRLRAALEIARRVPARLDRSYAVEWLESQLSGRVLGEAAVVYHSVVMPYLARSARDRVRELIQMAGARATTDAPVAWLYMEPGADQADIRLTLWPGGVERLIATSAFHGPPVKWVPE